MSINIFLCKFLFSDKMNSRNKIILSGALLALVMLVATNVFISPVLADVAGSGDVIQTALSVYTVKKAALICDQGASAPPSQFPPQIGGCIDVINKDSGIGGNMTDFRYNQYLFTGEQLAELVVARDLSTSVALPSTASLKVDGVGAVTCVDVTSLYAGNFSGSKQLWWYGHNVYNLLTQLPPKQGISDPQGFNPQFDKIYNCLLTVTPAMTGSPSVVSVSVTDLSQLTASTDPQKWYFNPAISIDVTFSSGSSIMFPPAQAGQVVESSNTLMIANTADGGVDLAAYIVGHDLTSSSVPALCPDSNVLDINNMDYRCKVGTYMSDVFTPVSHIKEANLCKDLSLRKCLVQDGWSFKNDLLPDATSAFTSILYNGHTAECWFQLTVPIPCMGTYSASNAIEVLVRAI
jgi:hypothetical protein